MLLIVTHSRPARRDLRNVCRRHDDCVVQSFGRVTLLSGTEFAAFQALRLQEKHGLAVQIERVEPFERSAVPDHVTDAARAYEQREQLSTPYERFASGRELPSPETMRGESL